MRIQSSEITMGSARRFVEQHEERETLRVWWGRGTLRRAESQEARIPEAGGDRLSLSARARSNRANKQAKTVKDGETDTLSTMDSKLYVIKALVEKLTGKRVTVLDASALDHDPKDPESPPKEAAPPDQNPREEGWGITYNHHESHYESEDTLFAAQGMIRTKEGEEVNFSLYLRMNREFLSEESTILRAGDAALVDPLVINFDGSAADLTNTRFNFDLDADGEEERIPFVGPGSGVLVLDIDKDGRITDGSELFGPRTGNGFGELAVHDHDGNHWIDENDGIFDDLAVWTKDIQGNDRLTPLRERGIGAIYLDSMDSPFDLKNHANQLQGQVSRSGIYVEENGTVKTIQQINMTV